MAYRNTIAATERAINRSLGRMKHYIDMQLSPFIKVRVLVLRGTVSAVDTHRGEFVAYVNFPNYGLRQTTGIFLTGNRPKADPNKQCRFLLDSQSQMMWYSGVLPGGLNV